jgi:hypothetical protein
MFPKGTIVYHRDSKRSGSVLECDGDTVYILQANGAEIEFPAAELTTRPPDQPAPAAAATAPRPLTAADVTPEHDTVLRSIPARTLQAVATLFESQPRAGKFSALGPAQKLNFIAEVTGIPYPTMRKHRGSPGELGLLMGKGLADSQRKRG